MLESIPNFKATTYNPISVATSVLEIDAAGAELLRRRLKEGNWIYSSLSDGISFEVVKITSIAGNEIAIDREQDGTIAASFVQGAKLAWILGVGAVDDIIENRVNAFALTGSGAAVVTKTGVLQYNIDAKRVTLISGDEEIEIIDVFPTFIIHKT